MRESVWKHEKRGEKERGGTHKVEKKRGGREGEKEGGGEGHTSSSSSVASSVQERSFVRSLPPSFSFPRRRATKAEKFRRRLLWFLRSFLPPSLAALSFHPPTPVWKGVLPLSRRRLRHALPLSRRRQQQRCPESEARVDPRRPSPARKEHFQNISSLAAASWWCQQMCGERERERQLLPFPLPLPLPPLLKQERTDGGARRRFSPPRFSFPFLSRRRRRRRKREERPEGECAALCLIRI